MATIFQISWIPEKKTNVFNIKMTDCNPFLHVKLYWRLAFLLHIQAASEVWPHPHSLTGGAGSGFRSLCIPSHVFCSVKSHVRKRGYSVKHMPVKHEISVVCFAGNEVHTANWMLLVYCSCLLFPPHNLRLWELQLREESSLVFF